jgi:ATP-binding cassette subfamily B (MDR/TAP) protein 1
MGAQYHSVRRCDSFRHTAPVDGLGLWQIRYRVQWLRGWRNWPSRIPITGQQIHVCITRKNLASSYIETCHRLYFLYLFVAKFALVYTHSVHTPSARISIKTSHTNQPQVLISISAIRTTKALRIDFIKHILRQDIAYFDSDSAASVTVQATTNGNNVNNGISEKLTLTIQGVSTFVSAFIIAFIVQWKLTLITICIVPSIVIAVGVCIAFDTKNETQLLAIYSKAGLIAEEVFSTVRTVHAFWLNPLLSRRYDKLLGDAMDVGMKKSPIYSILFSAEFFCIYCGYGLAFWQGIRRYISGEIDQVGDV